MLLPPKRGKTHRPTEQTEAGRAVAKFTAAQCEKIGLLMRTAHMLALTYLKTLVIHYYHILFIYFLNYFLSVKIYMHLTANEDPGY